MQLLQVRLAAFHEVAELAGGEVTRAVGIERAPHAAEAEVGALPLVELKLVTDEVGELGVCDLAAAVVVHVTEQLVPVRGRSGMSGLGLQCEVPCPRRVSSYQDGFCATKTWCIFFVSFTAISFTSLSSAGSMCALRRASPFCALAKVHIRPRAGR